MTATMPISNTTPADRAQVEGQRLSFRWQEPALALDAELLLLAHGTAASNRSHSTQRALRWGSTVATQEVEYC